jgi:membrane protein DedA with SNARE-associated domain
VHNSVVRLVESYGYAVVFLFVGIESLGIPLPGETVLVTAAALAALGHLSIWWVIAIAAAGGIVGDAAGYWIGRLGGIALIRRYGRFVHFDEAKLEKVHTFFDKHGSKAVFFGRFIALLRTWAAVLAGTAEMPYRVFTLYNVLGGITWATLFGTLGYLLGEACPFSSTTSAKPASRSCCSSLSSSRSHSRGGGSIPTARFSSGESRRTGVAFVSGIRESPDSSPRVSFAKSTSGSI